MSGIKMLVLGRRGSQKISNFSAEETYSSKVFIDSPTPHARTPQSVKESAESPVSHTPVQDESFGVDAVEAVEAVDEHEAFGVGDDTSLQIDGGSAYTEPKEPPKMVVFFSERVKPVMKSLKRACKYPAEEEAVLEAVVAVHELASTTYEVRSKLGSIGACDALVILLDKCRANAELVVQIFRAMGALMICNDTNTVKMGQLGGCRLCVRMMAVHSEDPSVLEACCKLLVEFG